MRKVLANQGFPSSIFSAWEAEGMCELLPIQLRAVEAGVLTGKSCVVIGPTSCGKTFVGEMVCVKQVLMNRPSLYLVPFKALAEEKHVDFTKKYARPEIGATVLISTADHREHDDDVPLVVEGGERLLMETPYPTFLLSASCPSLGSSKYAWSIQSSL